MKHAIQLTRERNVRLSVPAENYEPHPYPEKAARIKLGRLAGQLAAACCKLGIELWRLFALWSTVPAVCAVLYIVLRHFGFPFPGLGIFAGAFFCTAHLHRGASSPYFATRQGFILYAITVTIGHRDAIFANSQFLFDNVTDILLLARGEPITRSHWLGLFCLAFSSAFFDFRRACSPSCPGNCFRGYRQHLQSTRAALARVNLELAAVLRCAFEVLTGFLQVVFLRRSRAASARQAVVTSEVRIYEREELTLIAETAQADPLESASTPLQLEATKDRDPILTFSPRPLEDVAQPLDKPQHAKQKKTP